jgi:hypothetical protein
MNIRRELENRGTIFRCAAVVLCTLMGCAGKQGAAGSPGSDGTGSQATADGGAEAAAPAPRAFASTPMEAQSLIQGQIDTQMKALWKCVIAFRTAKGDPHKAVVVDIGIDQEGSLLGLTAPNPKQGDLDPAMRECMRTALHGLPFPRSHAGIITVRQTFTDVSMTP